MSYDGTYKVECPFGDVATTLQATEVTKGVMGLPNLFCAEHGYPLTPLRSDAPEEPDMPAATQQPTEAPPVEVHPVTNPSTRPGSGHLPDPTGGSKG